jgi:signal transduction histidine kinase
MTQHLRERTAEAARLYAETVQRNNELADINARLQSAQQQLIQSEKLAAVGQLTAGIVHDVKNPLAVIKGLAESLQEEPGIEAGVHKDLSVIRESAAKANQIVSDLLKFSRQSTPEMQHQDLRATAEAALRITAYLARQAHVQVIADLPGQSVLVTYDAQQIEQVLINMIQNAIQAMPHGGTLRMSLSQAGEAVALAVQDTGVGIPPENLRRVFDPFFTTKPEGEGTGLGLSVSYGIITHHRGRIDVKSTVGQGTTFTILLPTHQPSPIS